MIPLSLDNLYPLVFQNAVVAIAVTDSEGKFINVNPAWCEFMGYSAEEALTLKVKDVTPEEDQDTSSKSFVYLTEERGRSIRKQRRYQRKDGSVFLSDLHVAGLFDDNGEVIGLIAVFVNIDKQIQAEQIQAQLLNNMELINQELSEANKELEKLARHDTLTGLYNRRVLDDILHREGLRSQRTKRGFGIAIADIDNFKHINDTYGHDCGDTVLKELSHIFLNGIRTTDTTGRWGGEEFLFIFPETSCQGALIVIERIRSTIEALTLNCGEKEIKITCTIGLSYHHGDIETKNMIEEADKALYEGKRSGKNKVVCYQDICSLEE
ncbi:MAG: sensor domain-containing diguanylate cyclase [Candidatus Cloacimonetes bacterium]|nr:sensor domain-containing diguanylate cyclase [Candidatus Cloacimonadota bacterium]